MTSRSLDHFRRTLRESWELPDPPGNRREPICLEGVVACAEEATILGIPIRAPMLLLRQPSAFTYHALPEIELAADGSAWEPGQPKLIFALEAVRRPGSRDGWRIVTRPYPLVGGFDVHGFRDCGWYDHMSYDDGRSYTEVLGNYLELLRGDASSLRREIPPLHMKRNLGKYDYHLETLRQARRHKLALSRRPIL